MKRDESENHEWSKRVIGRFDKNKREEIVFEIDSYKGHPAVHIRIWVRDQNGNSFRTKKGVNFNPTKLSDCINWLKKIEDIFNSQDGPNKSV